MKFWRDFPRNIDCGAVKFNPIETTKAIALGAGAFILYSLFRKGYAAGTLNFYPGNIKDLYIENARPVIILGVAAQNTSNQSFTVNSFAGNLYANGYLVGNVSNFTPQTISRNSEKIIDLKIRLGVLGVVNNIIQAWNNGSFQQDLEFDGYANVDNLQVHVPLKYQIG